MKNDNYEVPPLRTGGLILTYRCSGSCRHCGYRCSEHLPDEWMSPETLNLTLDALANEPLLEELHLAGGELGLNLGFTLATIRAAVSRGLPLAYVQTNGFWADDYDRSVRCFSDMKEAGLKKVWISVTPFHVEHIPFARTETCINAATAVFGRDNLIIHAERIIPLLSSMATDHTHTLDEFCEVAGITKSVTALADLYPVTLYGRACQGLRDYCTPRPASEFAGQSCANQLLSANHFHIDSKGNLITGKCPGISVATIEDLHPRATMIRFPVFCTLVADGPYGLLLWAREQPGFQWDNRSTFVSCCDLCLKIRAALLRSGIHLRELRPQTYYKGLI
jgi:hypothetical protein